MKKFKPDICTGGCTPPQDYCPNCSHATFIGRGKASNGKTYKWAFEPKFGPTFFRKGAEEADWWPNSRHPAWAAFEKWHGKFKNKKESA